MKGNCMAQELAPFLDKQPNTMGMMAEDGTVPLKFACV